MAEPSSASGSAQLRHANELLHGFDIADGETKHFLSSIIVSNDLPLVEREELVRLSLMRGVEEWNMLFECAAALRDKALEAGDDLLGTDEDGESSLLPFLGRLLAVSTEGGEILGVGKRGASEVKDGDKSKMSPGKVNGRLSRFWEGRGMHVKTDSVTGMGGVMKLGDVVNPAESRKASRPATLPSASSTEIQQPTNIKPIPTTQTDPAPQSSANLSTSNPKRSRKSPFFCFSITPPEPSSPKKPRPPRGTISSLPIPRLSSPTFGLIQESLASQPFRLLIAVTFLIRTHGTAAIPIFHQLMERFPTPEDLAAADPNEIEELIRPLGLAKVRCKAIKRYAKRWVERPPDKGKRFGVRGYPYPLSGTSPESSEWSVKAGEEFGAEDDLSEGEKDAVRDARDRAVGHAWEIGHLTTGPYALDSWRIFCRDVLLGRAEDWMGKGAAPRFQPEWMRVLPRDKELRACLRWMWMREGWAWNPVTGDREPLSDEMQRAVDEGRVAYDDTGGLVILGQSAPTK